MFATENRFNDHSLDIRWKKIYINSLAVLRDETRRQFNCVECVTNINVNVTKYSGDIQRRVNHKEVKINNTQFYSTVIGNPRAFSCKFRKETTENLGIKWSCSFSNSICLFFLLRSLTLSRLLHTKNQRTRAIRVMLMACQTRNFFCYRPHFTTCSFVLTPFQMFRSSTQSVLVFDVCMWEWEIVVRMYVYIYSLENDLIYWIVIYTLWSSGVYSWPLSERLAEPHGIVPLQQDNPSQKDSLRASIRPDLNQAIVAICQSV